MTRPLPGDGCGPERHGALYAKPRRRALLVTNKRVAVVLALVAAVGAAGCPSNRRAVSTMRGATVPVPTTMQAAAPPALSTITRLHGPESVLYDADQDVYLVSNLNGGLQTADNNGFITRIDPRTMNVQLKWIESGRGGVRLDAPKGMGLVGDTLYVSDIHAVRMFDRRTGRPTGEIHLPGATLINDIASDGKSVYVSDTGLRVGPGSTFLETGTDAIWKITGKRAEKIASGKELEHPNGLAVVDGDVWAVTFGHAELYSLHEGVKKRRAALPDGLLDGVVPLADGSLLVSSWLGEGIYRGRPGKDFVPILTGIDAPADIGYDTRRRLLLIPHANQVTIHAVR
jgi:hypothetical protein